MEQGTIGGKKLDIGKEVNRAHLQESSECDLWSNLWVMLSLTASPPPMGCGCCFPSLLLFSCTAPNEVLCPHLACLSLCCQPSFPAINDFPIFSSTSLLGNPDTLDFPAECFLLRVRSKDSNFRVGDVMFLGMVLHSQEKMLPLGACSL